MTMTVDDDVRKTLSAWTEVDEGLDDCDPKVADAVLQGRLGFGAGDIPRSQCWQDPEGIDVVADIPYMADGARGHRLDVYFPHDAVVRGGKSLPVYIDIHGGGFIYAYKELNRNFGTHLAAKGFAVFSVDYRLAPGADFIDQLTDIEHAFAWIKAHLADYPVDPTEVCIVGDSVGGTFGLYTSAIEASKEFSDALGVPQAGFDVRASTLFSGMYDLRQCLSVDETYEGDPADPMTPVLAVAPAFFKRFKARAAKWADIDTMVDKVALPPLYLNTTNDDFLEADSLALASVLSRHGRDFEIHDRHTRKGETLGHVYPVSLSWLPESDEAMENIRRFTYERL